MKHTRRLHAQSSRVAHAMLVAMCAGALALACASDHVLGDLNPDNLLDGEPGDDPATAETGQDTVVSPVLGAPDVTFGTESEESPFHRANLAVGLGDLNGDGFQDFATNGNDLATGTSYAHLRYGGPRPAAEREFAFAESGARLFYSRSSGPDVLDAIAPAGDVDADGYADFLVGIGPCGAEPTARAYLVYGGPEPLEGALSLDDVGAHLRVRSEGELGGGGCNILSGSPYFVGLGDFDGDGFDDFMLSDRRAQLVEGSPDSTAYLFYGGAQRIATGTSWREADARLSARQDLTVTPLRDVNGDGLGDLVLGAWPRKNDELPSTFYWLPGRAERLSGSVDIAAVARAINQAAPAGDLDADGIHEVFLYDDDGNPHLFYGAPGLFGEGVDLSQAAVTFAAYVGPTDGDVPGRPRYDGVPRETAQVSMAGDLDGDGDDELIASIHADPSGPTGFQLAIVSSSRERSSGPAPFHAPSKPFRDEFMLEGITAVGDLDGDGAGELITVTHLYSGGDYPSWVQGAFHIHYGIPGGMSVAPPR